MFEKTAKRFRPIDKKRTKFFRNVDNAGEKLYAVVCVCVVGGTRRSRLPGSPPPPNGKLACVKRMYREITDCARKKKKIMKKEKKKKRALKEGLIPLFNENINTDARADLRVYVCYFHPPCARNGV